MLRLVLRPLLVVLTLGMLVIALFQVGGRIAVALLDDLEPGVNQLLSVREIRVTGLSGDWRMLNPILRADRVEYPAGHLDGVVIEIDMVASVLRGTLLARRLKVDHLQVDVEKPAGEPWRLRGDDGGPDLDLLPFLTHSGQLELEGVVVFTREGLAPVEMTLSYLGINRGGEHRHALELGNSAAECADTCRLQMDLYSHAALWPLRPVQARITARSSGFLLPKVLLGVSPLKLDELDLDWQRNQKESGGTLKVAAEQFDLPGSGTLAMRLEGAIRGRGHVHQGAVSAWRVQQGDEVWDLPRMAVTADRAGVHGWMPELDLQRASQFLRQALAGVAPAERWLTGLNVRGRAHNLRAFYPFDGSGPSYALTVDGVRLDAFNGAPSITNAAGELFGHQHGVQLNLNSQDMAFALPDLFHGRWQLPYAQGVLQAWFSREYFGLRGHNMRLEALGSRAAGSFAISRPPDQPGQRLLLLINAEPIGVAEVKQFVPYKLPDRLRAWLEDGPRGGILSDARLAYQGQLKAQPGAFARRLELVAQVEQGQVRYHPDWPEVTDVSGRLAVMGTQVDVEVSSARSAGASLGKSRVTLLDNGAVADVSLDARLDAARALALVRSTPLQNWLGFVEPDWRGEGPMRVSGELRVPLGGRNAASTSAYALEVRLRADLEGVQLALPRYRTELAALQGSLRYRHPRVLDAADVTGRLFGEPVRISASSDQRGMHLRFAGRAGSADVWQLLDFADPGLAEGDFGYQAHLTIAVAPGQVTELRVASVLDGLAISLPGGYGKAADAEDDAHVQLRFLPEHRSVSFDYRDVAGWLEFDRAPLRGAVGFAAPPPSVEPEARELVVGGVIAGFALDDILPRNSAAAVPVPGAGADAGAGMRLPVRLDDLEVDEILVGRFPLTRAILRGYVSSDGFDLQVRSRELTGNLSRGAKGPMAVKLEQLHIAGGTTPAGASGTGATDPLNPALISQLPAADVELQTLMLGDEDYGSWRFQLRSTDGVLQVRELEALVRGVRIAAPEGLDWRADGNETQFSGTLSVDNLAAVLPQWGYAPTVETGTAELTGSFTWPGSPAAVDLLTLRGRAEARAEPGRFLDVEPSAAGGAQRIFSLLNFTAIAKRMSLNFSDVFGRGISFDKLKAQFSLDDGVLEFVEPLQVEGTGSSFRVSGTVDLRARRLNNEMVVTLPVSKGLPWYAAYVALANPLAGLGMLVGERVLRKPLEQFSSAKYRIGGTLDDPEVRFVNVFDMTTIEPAGVAETRAADADNSVARPSEEPSTGDDEQEAKHE